MNEKAARHGVFMFNMHALGGFSMMKQAAEAIQAGADYIVVGRPVTGAPNPLAAVKGICDQLCSV